MDIFQRPTGSNSAGLQAKPDSLERRCAMSGRAVCGIFRSFAKARARPPARAVARRAAREEAGRWGAEDSTDNIGA